MTDECAGAAPLQLGATADPAHWHVPRCPKCGSRNVREWGTIYVGYDVIAISMDGMSRTMASGMSRAMRATGTTI